jgi:outer membrane immunogenic protein
MKRFLVGSAAVFALALAGPALAADLPVKAPIYKAPVAAPVYEWTGFYAGLNGGYSWGPWDSSSIDGIFPGSTGFGTTFSPDVKGWVFGGQAGYNWQLNAQWLVGIEGDIQITGERASVTGATSFNTPISTDFHAVTNQTTTDDWKFPWFATLRLRGGVLVEPHTLFYATGGLAAGEFKFANSFTSTSQIFLGTTSTTPFGPAFTTSSAFSTDLTRIGGAIGAGIEHKFSPNWSIKAEYLYLDFGSATFLTGSGFDTNVRLRDNILRLGINFKFDGPVVAKY